MTTKRKTTKKAASKKKVTTKNTGTKKKTTKKTTKSKMDKAVLIMEKMFFQEGKERKDIIPVLMKEAGLTKAGAGTYYQLIKNRILEDES